MIALKPYIDVYSQSPDGFSDGWSEHVAHARMKIGIFREKK